MVDPGGQAPKPDMPARLNKILGDHAAAGVTHVVSRLGPNAPDPPGFAGFPLHLRLILPFHDVTEPQPAARSQTPAL
jgi:hypothetical protein